MTKTQLKKKLWPLFATYIKNRDKWTCVTCGREARGQGMNAGHYIAKAACGAEYYFSEQNVHAQCSYCNLALEGNRPAYRAFLLRQYGQEVLTDLETGYRLACPDFPYEEKIAHYKLINSQTTQEA